jgi:nitrogen fixation/metabolism regulation signal transduction histidine kinase
MIRAYAADAGRLKPLAAGADSVAQAVWIDLISPTAAETEDLEKILGVDIPTREEMEEIEISFEKSVDDTREGNGFILLKIRDDGPGIPEGEIKRVFDLFYTTKEKGSGLGLPICKKIMEDHGGSIEIESKIGEGTTVILKFPT